MLLKRLTVCYFLPYLALLRPLLGVEIETYRHSDVSSLLLQVQLHHVLGCPVVGCRHLSRLELAELAELADWSDPQRLLLKGDSGLEHGRRCKVSADLETRHLIKQVLMSIVLEHLKRSSLRLSGKRGLGLCVLLW